MDKTWEGANYTYDPDIDICEIGKLVCGERSVHSKNKYATGHMDRLLRKTAGPQQTLPVQTLIENRNSQGSCT